MDKLFIIDLMPFLYRGHFVFLRNPRLTASGINTSALLCLANGLLSILKREKPTHAVLAMDPGGPTFRHRTPSSWPRPCGFPSCVSPTSRRTTSWARWP